MNLVDEIIERRILKEQKEDQERPRSGLISPSSMGRCYRYQIWHRQNRPFSNPPDMRTLKKFHAGKVVHQDIQGYLPPEQIEYEFTIYDVHGFVDYLDDVGVWEFKSCGSWQFEKVTKEWYNVEKDNYSYCLQLMLYVVLLSRKMGHLVFVEKDSYASKEYVLHVNDWKEQVHDELSILRALWREDKMPKAMPRAYGLKECNYCVFRNDCDKVEGNKAKDRETLAKEERKNRAF